MHLDPLALIHIPSGETAVCSVVVILSDTNNCLFNLSSAILFGIWNTWKHHILFLALGLEHFFLHNVQGCPAALGNSSKNYRAKKVKFKVVHCELRMPKEGRWKVIFSRSNVAEIVEGSCQITRLRTWDNKYTLYKLWGRKEREIPAHGKYGWCYNSQGWGVTLGSHSCGERTNMFIRSVIRECFAWSSEIWILNEWSSMLLMLSNWEDCGKEDNQQEMNQHDGIGKCLEMER